MWDGDMTYQALGKINGRLLRQDGFCVVSAKTWFNNFDMYARFLLEGRREIVRESFGRPVWVGEGRIIGRIIKAEIALKERGRLPSINYEISISQCRDTEFLLVNLDNGIYQETLLNVTWSWGTCNICQERISLCDHVPGKQYGRTTCACAMEGVSRINLEIVTDMAGWEKYNA